MFLKSTSLKLYLLDIHVSGPKQLVAHRSAKMEKDNEKATGYSNTDRYLYFSLVCFLRVSEMCTAHRICKFHIGLA